MVRVQNKKKVTNISRKQEHVMNMGYNRVYNSSAKKSQQGTCWEKNELKLYAAPSWGLCVTTTYWLLSYYCLCWPTSSSTEHITCCRPHLILFSLSYGTGMAVASSSPEGPMEVFNEPGIVFPCSDEQFFSLLCGGWRRDLYVSQQITGE